MLGPKETRNFRVSLQFHDVVSQHGEEVRLCCSPVEWSRLSFICSETFMKLPQMENEWSQEDEEVNDQNGRLFLNTEEKKSKIWKAATGAVEHFGYFPVSGEVKGLLFWKRSTSINRKTRVERVLEKNWWWTLPCSSFFRWGFGSSFVPQEAKGCWHGCSARSAEPNRCVSPPANGPHETSSTISRLYHAHEEGQPVTNKPGCPCHLACQIGKP